MDRIKRFGCTFIALTAGITSAVSAQSGRSSAASTAGTDSVLLAQAFQRAAGLVPLNSLLIARDGKLIGERYFRGMRRDRAVNIKSASKSIISALVGIAIQQGKLRLDQPIAELLPEHFRAINDPVKRTVTVRHLLSMTAGIESTSFDHYGSWVASRNWVRNALSRPMTCDPGTCMVYSTGNSHILSTILTRVTGLSTRAYANRYLFGPLGISIGGWTRDPQGVYLGGNEMQLTPRQLLRFGQLYLDGGRAGSRQLLGVDWIRESWGEYAVSPFNGHHY
ncbi:MAG TPA: serine hydrolase, partial [Longimicrobiales bacterium]|nr:serine hydrolase [Longimicrobiales bacterium]